MDCDVLNCHRKQTGRTMKNRLTGKNPKIVLAGAVAALLAAMPHGQLRADTFQPGEFVSNNYVPLDAIDGEQTQFDKSLVQNFDSVYASSGGLMQIGIPGAAGNSIIFDNGPAVVTFESGTGPSGSLTTDLLDPVTSSGGVFAMDVAALEVTTAFDRAGISQFKGTSNVLFQNLTLTGLSGDELWANGLSVEQVLAEANVVLGGGPLPNNKTNLTAVFGLVDEVDSSFNAGDGVSTWADAHLLLPTSGGGGGGGSGTMTAPEIDPAGAMSGLTLLAGALAILRARKFRVARLA
jgi:hypothetical protein